MDKPESTKSISEPTQSFVSPAVNDHVEATAGTNGAAPTGTPTDPAEFADEEYQDYEEEEYGEDMQYEEEEFGSGDTFEITASGESADFGEGFEGREEDMLEDVRTKIREMEEEAEKLRQLQSDSEKSARPSIGQQMVLGGAAPPTDEKQEVDARSVYVGQVDYSCSTDELEAHFRPCGVINRATIMCDRFTGHPKGYAYIEFASKDSVDAAVALTDSTLKDRQIKVIAKRTNVPGMGFAARRSRRPYRGGYIRSRRPYGRPYNPYYRGRSTYRGGFRGGYRRPRSRFIAY